MQQDQHRGLVAGVEPNRIPDGESKTRYGILRDEAWAELVRQQKILNLIENGLRDMLTLRKGD